MFYMSCLVFNNRECCNPEVSKWKSSTLEQGKMIAPSDMKEIQHLNDICEKCPSMIWHARNRKKECPKCHRSDSVEDIGLSKKINWIDYVLFKCSDCKINFLNET